LAGRWSFFCSLVADAKNGLRIGLLWTILSGAKVLSDTLAPESWKHWLTQGNAVIMMILGQWSLHVWVIGLLIISLFTLFEVAYRRVAGLEVRLAQSPLAWQRNAGEIEPWRERGITIMWQWQLPEFANTPQAADAWRTDMVNRLTRKYGPHAAGVFNNIQLQEYRALGVTQATPYAGHVIRIDHLRGVIHEVATGHFPSLADGAF
jgi:hypothetical protein